MRFRRDKRVEMVTKLINLSVFLFNKIVLNIKIMKMATVCGQITIVEQFSEKDLNTYIDLEMFSK